MSDTQYRIFEKSPGFARTYIATAYVDALGVAVFSWTTNAKDARLFDSIEQAARIAAAIEKTAAEYNAQRIYRGPACRLSVVPATGGHSKARGI